MMPNTVRVLKAFVLDDPGSGLLDAVYGVRSILGFVRLNCDLVSRFQRILCPAKPHQAIGIRGLDHPADLLATWSDNIHSNPSMRIDHLPLDDDTFKSDRFLSVELRGERVMRDRRAARRHDDGEQR